MPQTTTVAMEATEYIPIQVSLPLDLKDPQSIESFGRAVTLQAQGDAVELFEGHNSSKSAIMFASVYNVATEAVLHLTDTRSVLLFDHSSGFSLRPEHIDETIWSEILKFKNKGFSVQDVAMPEPETLIDLNWIWSHVKENDDTILRTKAFIKSFAPVLNPSLNIVLQGEIPTLPFLVALYLLRPYGQAIQYKDNSGATIPLFS